MDLENVAVTVVERETSLSPFAGAVSVTAG
jgi:hypothetical protein